MEVCWRGINAAHDDKERSRRYLDISPSLYQLWLDALIATSREFDEEFSESIETARRDRAGGPSHDWRLDGTRSPLHVCSSGLHAARWTSFQAHRAIGILR